MDFTQTCYEDTLRMARLCRSIGKETEANIYDGQAERLKRKMEEVKTMNHTKGPWRVKEMNGELFVANGTPTKGTIITNRIFSDSMFKPDGSMPVLDDEARANARLIAAAPELLKACQKIYQIVDAMPDKLIPAPVWNIVNDQIYQAIEKAKGGP